MKQFMIDFIMNCREAMISNDEENNRRYFSYLQHASYEEVTAVFRNFKYILDEMN